jgi:hypothetical protein
MKSDRPAARWSAGNWSGSTSVPRGSYWGWLDGEELIDGDGRQKEPAGGMDIGSPVGFLEVHKDNKVGSWWLTHVAGSAGEVEHLGEAKAAGEVLALGSVLCDKGKMAEVVADQDCNEGSGVGGRQ